MTDRSERNAAIVRQLEAEANAMAAAYMADVEEFARLNRWQRMVDLLEELAEWMEQHGDAARLMTQGVAIDDDDGELRLVHGDRVMSLRARDDMTISVDGQIMEPDRDCPILDARFYEEVMSRINRWVDQDEDHKPRWNIG